MRKIGIIAVLSLLAVAFAAVPALAVTNFANAPQGAHFARGEAEPVCTITGTTVSCTDSAVQGVGNTNATQLLSVTSTFTGTCANPGNNPNDPIEPFTESATTSTSNTLLPTRNGRIDIPAVSATAPGEEEFLATFECPNPRWQADVATTNVSYTYTVTFAGFTAPFISLSGSAPAPA